MNLYEIYEIKGDASQVEVLEADDASEALSLYFTKHPEIPTDAGTVIKEIEHDFRADVRTNTRRA